MSLGGGGGSWSMTLIFTTALSADFSFSCDYAFLWLNKSRHVAKCVHVATGKQETIKEAHAGMQ